MSTTLRFLGAAAYELVGPTHRVLIDPFLTGNPGAPVGPADLEAPDVLLITHAAKDHFGDSVEIAQRTGSRVVCDAASLALLLDQGVSREQIVQVIWGIGVSIDGLLIRAIEAHHGSNAVLADGTRISGTPLAFVVETEPNVRVYHYADTAIFDMRLQGELYRPTVGILGCTMPWEALHNPGVETYVNGEMTPDEAARAAEMLGLRLAIASHYMTPDDLVAEFLQLVPKHDTTGVREAVAPLPGQTLVLEPDGKLAMDLGLTGRRAIVTGGSHGLGRATARTLAEEGVEVAICGRHAETLEAVAKEITASAGVAVFPFVADLTVPSQLDAFVDAAVNRLGTVDILVNNADFATNNRDFFELTDEDWLEKIDIKLLAPIRLVRRLVPAMMERRWGRIINISGATARSLFAHGMPKGMTQAGLINLSKNLSVRLGPHGVNVNVVEPGTMWTDGATWGGRSRMEARRQHVQEAATRAGVSYEEMDRQLVSELVIGRRVEPDDSAMIIAFLASERAATITGEVIVADGGESRYVRY